MTDVTLAIPCYNAADYLPQLLDCARQQTIPFAEILCYDDGSIDATADVAASFGATVIQGKRNRGAAYARNQLLAACRTRWIHFHDADDLIDPQYVETLLPIARQHPEEVVVCNGQITTTGGKFEKVSDYRAIGERADHVAFLLRQFIHLEAMLFPVQALRRIGGFATHLRVTEDADLNVRLAASGVGYRCIERTLFTRLKHEDSLVARSDRSHLWRYYLVYLNRCRKRLPRKYHAIIGEKAFFCAWSQYCRGRMRLCRMATMLANKCNTYTEPNSRRINRMIARAFGTNAYMRARYLWAKMRGNLPDPVEPIV
jgi:glycosyltransferase involved in cell wall biosynthesis